MLLRRQHRVETIKGFGHKFEWLVTEAGKLDLFAMDEDVRVMKRASNARAPVPEATEPAALQAPPEGVTVHEITEFLT